MGCAVGHAHRGRAQPQRAAGRGADHRDGAQLRCSVPGSHRGRVARDRPGVALASGTQAEVEYVRYYPATVNTAAEAALALDAARAVGLQVQPAPRAAFTSEDFAFMLQRKPGAYLWLGQGGANPGPEGERPLHHPCYDFNDEALPLGVRWFCEVARRALAPA
ncbi:M20/M25/M40 family metallo-hydrolase [Ralstonia syzygii subsp. celebesensis]